LEKLGGLQIPKITVLLKKMTKGKTNENLNGNNIANKRRGEEVQVNTCRQIDGF